MDDAKIQHTKITCSHTCHGLHSTIHVSATEFVKSAAIPIKQLWRQLVSRCHLDSIVNAPSDVQQLREQGTNKPFVFPSHRSPCLNRGDNQNIVSTLRVPHKCST
jgi:hypothetical protein